MASRNVGFRVFRDIRRPARELVEKFRGLPTPNIADVMNRLSSMDSGIRPINRVPLLGVAYTVKAPCGDNLMIHRALHLAQPGDVIVVDGQGCMERSLAGEIMTRYAEERGIAGLLFDGCFRDGDGVQD